MMKKLMVGFGILTMGAVLLGSGSQALAQRLPDAAVMDPEAVARRCMEKADDKGAACERTIERTARRCVQAVRRLIDAGERERAARLARYCSTRIADRAQWCTDRIQAHCERCVDYLRGVGEPELATRVREFCAGVIEDIVNLLERALGAIADALQGGLGLLFDRS